MQTIVYQCDTAMPAQKLPNCCIKDFCNKIDGLTPLDAVQAFFLC